MIIGGSKKEVIKNIKDAATADVLTIKLKSATLSLTI